MGSAVRLPASLLLVAALLLCGCSAVPNLDAGSAGCQNAQGIGPRPTDGLEHHPDFMASLLGKSPLEAAVVATGLGHTVVFNVFPIGECWCKAPPGGQVFDAWWGEHGAPWLKVQGFTPDHRGADTPFLGWGC